METENVMTLTQSNEMDMAAIERLVIHGDLSRLSPSQEILYYRQVCDRAGLDWLAQPFDFLTLQGKKTLYCKKSGTDQLRKNNHISMTITDRKRDGDLYIVTAKAITRDGREDESTGVMSVRGLSGDALANAYMKAETKSKRRATLSICGLGMLDESEVETIPQPEPKQQVGPSVDRKVTEPQIKRLFAISKQCQWSQEDLKEYLKMAFSLESTKDLTMTQYDQFIGIIEKMSCPQAIHELETDVK